jgi:hypothetical protein
MVLQMLIKRVDGVGLPNCLCSPSLIKDDFWADPRPKPGVDWHRTPPWYGCSHGGNQHSYPTTLIAILTRFKIWSIGGTKHMQPVSGSGSGSAKSCFQFGTCTSHAFLAFSLFAEGECIAAVASYPRLGFMSTATGLCTSNSCPRHPTAKPGWLETGPPFACTTMFMTRITYKIL